MYPYVTTFALMLLSEVRLELYKVIKQSYYTKLLSDIFYLYHFNSLLRRWVDVIRSRQQ